MTTRPARERGFALLIVLWTMVLLALVMSHITSAGRTETLLAGNLRDNAMAETEADGAIQAAIFRLLDPSAAEWNAIPANRVVAVPGGVASVSIENDADKINPNTASPALLTALFEAVGADAAAAARASAAIVQWRGSAGDSGQGPAAGSTYAAAGRTYAPPGAALQSLAELRLVLGITPALLARSEGHLSLYQGQSPDFSTKDPVVLRALSAVAAPGTVSSTARAAHRGRFVTISARVTMRNGATFARRAVVRIGEEKSGKPYQIVTWEEPGAA